MSESIERMKAYSTRRNTAKGIDVEHIHGFDVSPDGGFELLLSDVDGAIARIEHLERVLLLAKLALEYHTQQTRPINGTAQTIAAIDEALKS